MTYVWPRGPMDKASDYESGDSRFESWRGRLFFLRSKRENTRANILRKKNVVVKQLLKKISRKAFYATFEHRLWKKEQREFFYFFSDESVLITAKIREINYEFCKPSQSRKLQFLRLIKEMTYVWPRGPMDKASDYESGDSRFESWRCRLFFLR